MSARYAARYADHIYTPSKECIESDLRPCPNAPGQLEYLLTHPRALAVAVVISLSVALLVYGIQRWRYDG